MTNTLIVPVRREHLNCMQMRAKEAAAFSDNPGLYDRVLSAVGGLTVFYAGEIVAIVFWEKVFPGVCEVALIPGESLPDHPFAARTIKKELLEETKDFRRVQAAVESGETQYRFMNFLGFKLDAVLPDYFAQGAPMNIWRLFR